MIQGIQALLVANSTVQTEVGASAKGDGYKIYPIVAEQDEQRPYVTLRRVSGFPTFGKNEVSDKDQIRFNVAAYADTYKKCLDILSAVRTVLENYTGTSAGVDFKKIWYVGSEDLFDHNDRTYVVVDSYDARVKR
jgi:hypothetical protein